MIKTLEKEIESLNEALYLMEMYDHGLRPEYIDLYRKKRLFERTLRKLKRIEGVKDAKN